MDEQQKQRIQQWIAGWQQAGQTMAHLRAAELPLTSTVESLLALADAYESCRLHFSPEPSSGLIEQQAWFQKYRILQEQHD